jgi:hypothetical protein
VDAAERGFSIADSAFEIIDTIDGARHALADGSADVFLWEKHMTQPLVDAGEFRRVGEREVPWPAFVVSARREYLVEQSGSLGAALKIVRDYAARLKSSENAAALISRTYDIELADARSWLAHVEWSRDAHCPEEPLRRVIDALQAQKIVPGRASVPISDIWQSLD